MMATARCVRFRSGFTLVELIVSVMLIGLLASVAVLAVRRFARADPADPSTIIRDSLDSALSTGRSITLEFVTNGRPALATINPDGSVLADSVLHVERFTGGSPREP